MLLLFNTRVLLLFNTTRTTSGPLLLLNTTRTRSGPPSTRAASCCCCSTHRAHTLRTPKHRTSPPPPRALFFFGFFCKTLAGPLAARACCYRVNLRASQSQSVSQSVISRSRPPRAHPSAPVLYRFKDTGGSRDTAETHTRQPHENLKNQPQNQPHPPTHARRARRQTTRQPRSTQIPRVVLSSISMNSSMDLGPKR